MRRGALRAASAQRGTGAESDGTGAGRGTVQSNVESVSGPCQKRPRGPCERALGEEQRRRGPSSNLHQASLTRGVKVRYEGPDRRECLMYARHRFSDRSFTYHSTMSIPYLTEPDVLKNMEEKEARVSAAEMFSTRPEAHRLHFDDRATASFSNTITFFALPGLRQRYLLPPTQRLRQRLPAELGLLDLSLEQSAPPQRACVELRRIDDDARNLRCSLSARCNCVRVEIMSRTRAYGDSTADQQASALITRCHLGS